MTLRRHLPALAALVALIGLILLFLSPAHRSFSTATYGGGDAYQTVWNFWWFHRVVSGQGDSLMFTRLLFYPDGAHLYYHTHNLLHALLAMPIIQFWGLIPAYNCLMLLTFLATGVLTFLLVRNRTGDAAAGLLGAILFTLCPYRIAHACGHLNLLSTQWLPLVALMVPWALHRRSWGPILGTALVIALVPFTCYYYFLYALLLTAWLLLDLLIRSPDRRERLRRGLRGGAILAGALALFSPFLIRMLRSGRVQPVAAGHDPNVFCADLWSFFLPGGLQIWEEPFRSIREGWTGIEVEQVTTLGFVGLGLYLYCLVAVRRRELRVWKLLVPATMILALGPILHVNGRALPGIPMPYRLLQMIPGLEIGGVTARWVILSQLGLAVLAGYALADLRRRLPRFGPILAGLLLLAAVVEFYPLPFHGQELPLPEYYRRIAREEGEFAVLDAPGGVYAMWGQTRHGKPIVGGYLSRQPLLGDLKSRRIPVIAELLHGGICQHRVLEQVDPNIDFAWGLEGPGAEMPEDQFAITWTGSLILPRPGSYRFRTFSDDGARLWVDDQLVIDDWEEHTPIWREVALELPARAVSLRLDYFEAGGHALCQLNWSGPGIPDQPIPPEVLRTPDGRPGLLGQYSFSSKLRPAREILPGIYFTDEEGEKGLIAHYLEEDRGRLRELFQERQWQPGLNTTPPAAPTGHPRTVQWGGSLSAPLSGDYHLEAGGPLDVTIWLDHQPVLQRCDGRLLPGREGRVHLTEGDHSFRMEVFWPGGTAHFNLWWRLPDYDGADLLCRHGIRYVSTFRKEDREMLEGKLGLTPTVVEPDGWALYELECPPREPGAP